MRKARRITALATPIIRALGVTYRWRVDGYQHYESIVASGKQPIFAFWHGRILPGMLFWRNRGIVVMTSQNFDGEWIAGILERFGYGTARGSSSRGGVRALVQLKRDMGKGKAAAFAVDGPRGPARVVQPGITWLAGATGNPILPLHIEAARHWSARSWDATQVPKPFTSVAVAIGGPLSVAATADEALEEGRHRLESALNGLEVRSFDMLRADSTSRP